MTRRDVDVVSRALLYAFLVLAGMQIFALVMLVACGDWAYGAHSQWFPMSREAFTLFSYGFLGVMKVVGLSLFLAPWVALRLVRGRLPE